MSTLDLSEGDSSFAPLPTLPSARELDAADWGTLDGAELTWTAALCDP